MVWQIVHKCDFEGGKVPLGARFPFLEFETLNDIAHVLEWKGFQGMYKDQMMRWTKWWHELDVSKPRTWLGTRDTVDKLEEAPGQRLIKTHLPLSLLPSDLVDTAKVVYVARNPRDVIVSYYHHHKLIKGHGFTGDLPQFARWFIRDKVMMSPYFPHIEQAWALKDHPNMLFLFYEEMKKDLSSVIHRVADFLQSELTEEQVSQLVEHLDIKNFRNNPAVNMEHGKKMGVFNKEGNFIRKGKVGGWKEEFEGHPEVEQEINEWVEKNIKNGKVEFIMT